MRLKLFVVESLKLAWTCGVRRRVMRSRCLGLEIKVWQGVGISGLVSERRFYALPVTSADELTP
jgi:hypothetical protein